MSQVKQVPKRDLYKVSEVAHLLSVTPQAIYKWIDEGKVKAIELGPRALRIAHAEVERLKAKGFEQEKTGDSAPVHV